MRRSKAQESEPKSGASIDERVAWLEKLAMSSQDVFKAQNSLIDSQGAMIDALKKLVDEHANRVKSIDPLIEAQGNTIEALDSLVRILSERGDEHSGRIKAIEAVLKLAHSVAVTWKTAANGPYAQMREGY